MSGPTWADRPMCAWDTETTGTDPETARIVTSATVTVGGGEAPAVAEWLINPGVEIPEAASAVHGVTTEQAVAQGAEPAAAVATIVDALVSAAALGEPIVIYNAAYDMTVLDRECRRYSLPTLTDRCRSERHELHIVDPLVLDRALDRYRRGKRTLSATAAHYGVTLTEADAHTAGGDCIATARVAWKLARRYPDVGGLRLDELMDYQAAAHIEWADQFGSYLRSKGKTDDISREWPLKAFTGGAEDTR